jgi:diguanylate cyclase (GGDEF)-like protein
VTTTTPTPPPSTTPTPPPAHHGTTGHHRRAGHGGISHGGTTRSRHPATRRARTGTGRTRTTGHTAPATTAGRGARAIGAFAAAGAAAAAAPHAGANSRAGTAIAALADVDRTLAPPQPSQSTSVIDRIEQVVPKGVWFALAAALLIAALAALAAWRTGLLARRRKREIAAASAAALTDPLTGALNRRGFSEAVERELDRARRYDRGFALAFVDVRGLKRVNDTAGHLAGDELLRQATGLLRDSARAHDVVGRLGGDELGLLLVEQSPAGAAAVIQRIQEEMPRARANAGLKVDWDLTIGTAIYPDDGDTFEELLDTADRRLYEQRGIALR